MAPNCRTVCARARGSQEYIMEGRLGAVQVGSGAVLAAQSMAASYLNVKAGVPGRYVALG